LHRRRNHIHELECDGRLVTEEQDNATAVFSFFDVILGTGATRSNGINLDALGMPSANLHELGERFMEEEILKVIHSLYPDKALGPDDFSVRFLQVAWEVIRPNILHTFDVLWYFDTQDLHSINGALLVLLPKSTEAR
jgi:hypothetical protein